MTTAEWLRTLPRYEHPSDCDGCPMCRPEFRSASTSGDESPAPPSIEEQASRLRAMNQSSNVRGGSSRQARLRTAREAQIETVRRSQLVQPNPGFADPIGDEVLRTAEADGEHTTPSPSLDAFVKSIRLGRVVEGY